MLLPQAESERTVAIANTADITIEITFFEFTFFITVFHLSFYIKLKILFNRILTGGTHSPEAEISPNEPFKVILYDM